MSNTTKNQITFDNGAVVFTRPDGGVYTVPASAVYVVYHDDTATFKLIALPRESGLAIMSTRASDVEVDGQSYSSIDDLKAALNDKFAKAAGGGVTFEVVEELPTSGETNIIYLVPSQDVQGTYDEYIWLEEEGRWELLGSTHIDLSGYVTDEEFSAHTANTSIHVTTALTNEILAISGKVDTNEQITAAALNELNSRFGIIAAELDDKQDVLVAGEGISISGNVISASGQGIVIDSTLDSGSTNAVANSAITAALDLKCDIGNGPNSPIISRDRNDRNYWMITKANGGHYLDSGWININGQPVITNGANEYFSGKITNLLLATEDEFSGHTADTSIHVTTAQTTAWSAKQDALTAGEGISISGNVISVSGGNESDVYWVNGDKWLIQGIDDTDWDGLVAALNAHKAIYATIQGRYFVCESMALNGNDLTFTTSMDDRFLWYQVTKNGSNDYSLTYGANTIGASQAALDELSGQVQTIDTVVATALNALNEEVSGATGSVSTLSGTVTGLSQSVNSLNGRVNNVEQNKPDVFLVPFKDLFDGTAEFDKALWMDIINAYNNHSVIMSEPMAGVDTEYQIISVDHPTTTQLILRLTSCNDEIVVDWNEGEDPEFDVATYKGARMRQISQADYNALVTKDPNTLYIINGNV